MKVHPLDHRVITVHLHGRTKGKYIGGKIIFPSMHIDK
jgi:hypothetical protein